MNVQPVCCSENRCREKAGSREEEATAETWGRGAAAGLEQGGGRGMARSRLIVGRF